MSRGYDGKTSPLQASVSNQLNFLSYGAVHACHIAVLFRPKWQASRAARMIRSNQPMKPTAPLRNNVSVFVTTPRRVSCQIGLLLMPAKLPANCSEKVRASIRRVCLLDYPGKLRFNRTKYRGRNRRILPLEPFHIASPPGVWA